jgi:hypothetical protein
MTTEHETQSASQPAPAPAQPVPQRRSVWRKVAIVGALAGAAVVGAGAVHAQWERRGDERSFGHHGRADRLARFCERDVLRYAPVARAFVKADLRLQEPQGAAFDALADTVLPGLESLKREVCGDFVSRTAPAPERLKDLADNLRRAADLAERAVAPAEACYATLDETQKQRLEQLTDRGRHGRAGPGRGLRE